MAGVKSGVRKKELTLRVALKIQEMRRISFAIEKLVVLLWKILPTSIWIMSIENINKQQKEVTYFGISSPFSFPIDYFYGEILF